MFMFNKSIVHTLLIFASAVCIIPNAIAQESDSSDTRVEKYQDFTKPETESEMDASEQEAEQETEAVTEETESEMDASEQGAEQETEAAESEDEAEAPTTRADEYSLEAPDRD